jgi:Lrp/AsnC family transcriptional regulator, regulator for asnA, asnC and gidA
MTKKKGESKRDESEPLAGANHRREGSSIDHLDHQILRILRTDGRTSNVEIARQLGVTETTVRKRIATLLADELVEIVAVPTPKLAGLNVSAIIGISVHLTHLKAVTEALVSRPEVRYCGVSTGRYDVMIEAFFASNEHVMEFATEVLGAMPGISDVETSLILKIEKFSYEWQFD